MKLLPERRIILISLILLLSVLISSQALAAQEKQLSYIIGVERESENLTEIGKTLERGYYDYKTDISNNNYTKEAYKRYNVTLRSFNGEKLYERSFLSPKFVFDFGSVDRSISNIAVPYHENGAEAVLTNPSTGEKKLVVDLTRFVDSEILKEERPGRFVQLYADIGVVKSVEVLKDKFPVESGDKMRVKLNVSNPNNFTVKGVLTDHNLLKGIEMEPKIVNYSLEIEPHSSAVRRYKIEFERVNLSSKAFQGRIEDIVKLGRAFFTFENKNYFSGRPIIAISESRGGNNVIMIMAIATVLVITAIAGYKLKRDHLDFKEEGLK